MIRRALVTGGAGFIGSHLVRGLVGSGCPVRVLDDLSSGKLHHLDGIEAELVIGDVADPAVLRDTLTDVSHVFHFAARPSVPESVTDPVGTHRVNLTGTVELLAASREAGVERLLFASSSAVYGEPAELPLHETSPTRPLSPYGVHKLASEHFARVASLTGGPDTVSFRFFNVYGPGQATDSAYAAAIPIFVKLCRDGKRPRIHGDGEQTRDFIHVSDIVDACVLAAGAEAAFEGEVFNLGLGQALTITELAETIMRSEGVDGSPEFGDPRPGDIVHSVASVDSVRRAFASRGIEWRPRYQLADGLATL